MYTYPVHATIASIIATRSAEDCASKLTCKKSGEESTNVAAEQARDDSEKNGGHSIRQRLIAVSSHPPAPRARLRHDHVPSGVVRSVRVLAGVVAMMSLALVVAMRLRIVNVRLLVKVHGSSVSLDAATA